MKIGIDSSRAFVKNRTGIEEYSYQVVKHLREELSDCNVILYLRRDQSIDFDLPKKWEIRRINFSRFWTQLGLSFEMFRRPIDVLFVPSHTVPFIHPKDTIVTIHGLEYEIMPEAYSFWERMYMRFSIKKSCRWAKKIISVSRNTKEDLMRLYGVPEEKIYIVYEGVSLETRSTQQSTKFLPSRKHKPYLLFVGRIEKRKNIEGIIEAYRILVEKYNISHKLVLAGRPGYGYESIKYKVENSKHKEGIIETGYVSEEEKYSLLKNAAVFLFPTFYEGFGLPILEAQSLGTPVVASNVSSLPEVGGNSVAYATPEEPVSISESVKEILSNEEFRDDLIKKGFENVKRFSWEKCANSISKLLMDKLEI